MSTLDDLGALHLVTQAAYAQKQQTFQKLVAEENRLRGELSRLDALLRESRRSDRDAREMRAIGADLLWQGWIGRSKHQLNLQLARVLAVKEHHLAEVRQAFGKKSVVERLLTEAKMDRAAASARASLNRAIDQSLFFNGRVGPPNG